ncbi:sialate O-acetylesterase [Algoriphagus sp. CAU 1675]|uniref:sialate O-acetylesterase n=1 Tax=Algoriphagus sp. CAU 1675 TaxID=3032597 RepID=UPI0023DA4C5C|nr:sialate O-acetylesterase [Algoriphagus sp. CAU 1675]MDF2157670.1 sialate O-acetylesterase [Algoriphagus sp. CAU 1675]
MKKLSYFLVTLLFLGSCDTDKFESDVELPKLFSDGMVIQRDIPFSVWGKGIPGRMVRVSVAGAIASGEVDADSTWHLKMPAAKAGGPFKLTVNQREIKDVFFGDVWLAGGQSNMEWKLKSQVIGAKKEFEEGGFPEIRFFKVPNSYAAVPLEDVVGGSWKVADSVNLPDFSAVAWFFAKRNHLEKKVPVGVIESNWGGTPAEGWTDAEILATMDASYTKEAKDVVENADKWQAVILENEQKKMLRDSLVEKPDSLLALKVSSIEYSDANWTSIQLPNANPLAHIAWLRKTFVLNSTDEISFHLPNMSQMAFIYLNGKQIHHKDWSGSIPDLKIASDLLNKGRNVLSIRIVNTWNNQPVVGEKGEMYLTQNGNKISLEGSWKYSNNIVEPRLPKVEYLNWKSGFMYNAMIYPLAQYPIKGAIWYQGESNAGRHEEYKDLFSTMISNWRELWEIGDFPFLFVQLANFMERKDLQPESDWAYLREAQRETLNLPNTGMAVIIDIGEAEDIHPRNKKDVGERLWLQARKVAYGEKIIAGGPAFKEVKWEEDALFVSFTDVGKGLKLSHGNQVKGFIVQDAEGQFEVAEAELAGPDLVRVQIPKGVVPVEIRYAWADNPEVNLVNDLNLPAIPFRTDF